MEGHPYYKIGRTINVDRRITQISPQMPGKIRLVSAIKVRDIYKSESVLHENFKSERMNGEWFRLSADDLTQIRLHLLVDQSFLLTEALLGCVNAEAGFVRNLTNMGRAAALLSRSVHRTQRRMSRYFAFVHERNDRAVDRVLDAEIVG